VFVCHYLGLLFFILPREVIRTYVVAFVCDILRFRINFSKYNMFIACGVIYCLVWRFERRSTIPYGDVLVITLIRFSSQHFDRHVMFYNFGNTRF